MAVKKTAGRKKTVRKKTKRRQRQYGGEWRTETAAYAELKKDWGYEVGAMEKIGRVQGVRNPQVFGWAYKKRELFYIVWWRARHPEQMRVHKTDEEPWASWTRL
jgi:hypothetical protein